MPSFFRSLCLSAFEDTPENLPSNLWRNSLFQVIIVHGRWTSFQKTGVLRSPKWRGSGEGFHWLKVVTVEWNGCREWEILCPQRTNNHHPCKEGINCIHSRECHKGWEMPLSSLLHRNPPAAAMPWLWPAVGRAPLSPACYRLPVGVEAAWHWHAWHFPHSAQHVHSQAQISRCFYSGLNSTTMHQSK